MWKKLFKPCAAQRLFLPVSGSGLFRELATLVRVQVDLQDYVSDGAERHGRGALRGHGHPVPRTTGEGLGRVQENELQSTGSPEPRARGSQHRLV